MVYTTLFNLCCDKNLIACYIQVGISFLGSIQSLKVKGNFVRVLSLADRLAIADRTVLACFCVAVNYMLVFILNMEFLILLHNNMPLC